MSFAVMSFYKYISKRLYQGRQTGGGGLEGSQPPLSFGWGVEHLSTPPDFEKKFCRGGWLPLN